MSLNPSRSTKHQRQRLTVGERRHRPISASIKWGAVGQACEGIMGGQRHGAGLASGQSPRVRRAWTRKAAPHHNRMEDNTATGGAIRASSARTGRSVAQVSTSG